MLNRLENLIQDPALVDQDSLNLCGPAAFFRVWLERDPLAVARFACELYDTGEAEIGNQLAVAPSSGSLIDNDYDAMNTRYGPNYTPEADWMLLGALRDAENAVLSFEGKPDEGVAAGTSPGEMEEWLEATRLYSFISNEGNFFLTKGADHALALTPNTATDVIMLINAHMLTQMNNTDGKKKSDDFIRNAFPNHFIVLTSPIQVANNQLQFSYWTWGNNYSGRVDRSIFEANYYGAIIARK